MRAALLLLFIHLIALPPVFGSSTQPQFPTTSQEPVLLRYSFSEGNSFDVKFDTKISTEITIGGQILPTQMLMPTTARCTIQNVRNEKITAKIQMNSFSMIIDGPGDSHTVIDTDIEDSPFFSQLNNAFRKPYQVTFTSRGELLAVEADDLTAELKKVLPVALIRQFKK